MKCCKQEIEGFCEEDGYLIYECELCGTKHRVKEGDMFEVTDQQVIEKLKNLELKTLCETGVRMINGGFAKADIFDFDAEYFDIELKWGVQSDCENHVTTEQYKMNRRTLEIVED